LHLQRGFAVSAEVEKGVAHLSGQGSLDNGSARPESQLTVCNKSAAER
jgi:hypothetical protein